MDTLATPRQLDHLAEHLRGLNAVAQHIDCPFDASRVLEVYMRICARLGDTYAHNAPGSDQE